MPQIGDWASFEELEALTGKHLDDVLTRALTTPFYSRRLTGPVTVDEFDSLPLTTKENLVEAYPFGLKAVPQTELVNYFESSSSGGHPTPAYYTRSDWVDLVERYARKPIGFRPADVLLVGDEPLSDARRDRLSELWGTRTTPPKLNTKNDG
ncbi:MULTISPECIES: hypothetical protein [unclassified Frankia]|uniref:hypothetical protein n=1 Tax=unclassified Frankia TaxID=2632575 RepID=UPI002AD3FB96|nr:MULTISPECIES: hypothetical protein [unclassified Frankia]